MAQERKRARKPTEAPGVERRPVAPPPITRGMPPQSLQRSELRPAQRETLARDLHRGAGNRAVGAMLQRRAGSTAAPERPPAPVPVQRGFFSAIAGAARAVGRAVKSAFTGIGKLFKAGDKTKMIQKAKAVKILEKSFKAYKPSISGGSVEVYGQAEFQVAYDKIYGEGEYSWEKYVVPKFGNLEGFAHEGVNYINKDTGSVDVVPHEMLHNNTHSAWTPVVGSNINEGTTEWLTIKAVTADGYTASHSYPNQEAVISALVGVIGEEVLMNGYFKGKVDAFTKAVDEKTKGGFAKLKTAMDAEDWVKAKAAVKAK